MFLVINTLQLNCFHLHRHVLQCWPRLSISMNDTVILRINSVFIIIQNSPHLFELKSVNELCHLCTVFPIWVTFPDATATGISIWHSADELACLEAVSKVWILQIPTKCMSFKCYTWLWDIKIFCLVFRPPLSYLFLCSCWLNGTIFWASLASPDP